MPGSLYTSYIELWLGFNALILVWLLVAAIRVKIARRKGDGRFSFWEDYADSIAMPLMLFLMVNCIVIFFITVIFFYCLFI